MSGSDPSVPSGGGGGASDCNIMFRSVLGSPIAEQVAVLSVGELLDLVKIENPRGVEARMLTGETVGAITRDIAELRRCMDEGNAYEAEVVDILGGAVTVHVRPQ